MAQTSKIMHILPISGKLNTVLNPVLVPFDQLVDSNNIIFEYAAGPQKRPGIVNYVDNSRIGVPLGQFILGYHYLGQGMNQTSNMQGMFDFWRNANSSQFQSHIVVINGQVYADNRGGSGARGVFGKINFGVTIDPADNVCFDVANGLLVMGFTGTKPKKWNMSGNISDLSSDVPNGKYYRTYLGSGWIGGVSTAPHRLYKSVDGDVTDWTTLLLGADSFDLDAGDSDPDGITAIMPPLFNDLYVAKRKAIYRITPSGTTYAAQVVSRGVGCVSHNSAVAINDDLFFASDIGIHSMATTQKYGNIQTTFLSADINNYYLSTVDFNFASNMWATYWPEYNSYILAYTSKGSFYNDTILGYNLTGQRWFKWEDINCAAICSFINKKGNRNVMIGSYDGNIGYFDKNTHLDYGETPINFMMKTGVLVPGGDVTHQYGHKHLVLHYKPHGDGVIDVAYQIPGLSSQDLTFSNEGVGGDTLDDTFVLDQSVLGGESQYKQVRKDLKGYGNGIQLTITNEPADGADEHIEMLGYSIEYTDASDTHKDVII